MLLASVACTVAASMAQSAQTVGVRDSTGIESGYQRIDRFMQGLTGLEASFRQVLRDSRGQIAEQSSGLLRISRPDRFRWDYAAPHAQVIVSDGSRLWLYDPDLEQVTVRSLAQGLGATPAMLLSGSGKVGDAFTAGPIEQRQGLTWYRLAPKQKGSDFERVSLGFDGRDELAAMELVDKLGQTTTIEFSRVKRGVALDDSLFRFVPPVGADVIGEAAAR